MKIEILKHNKNILSVILGISILMFLGNTFAISQKDINEANNYFKLGRTAVYSKNFNNAMNYLDNAISINPEIAEAYRLRARCKLELKNLQGAIEDLDEAIELAPNNSNMYMDRALCKSQNRDKKSAIDDYDTAIQLNPKNANAFFDRGIVKTELREIQGAIEDFEEAIRLNPNLAAEGYYKIGIIQKNLAGNYPSAIEYFTDAIKSNPTYAKAYYERSLCKEYLGNKSGAIEDKNIYLRLNNK